MALADRDVRLGPLQFRTVEGELKETLGDQLESVGAALVAGERRPRPFSLSLPIEMVASDGDPLGEAEKLRRQVRALMENARARLQGLWFEFAIDTVLNGWLLVGGADLSYTEQGTTFADYLLELTDCYRVGDRTTHRPARRVEVYDRRLATTPRDTLGRLYSTDFANEVAMASHYLPPGATDVLGALEIPLAPETFNALGGTLSVLSDRSPGEVLSFAQQAAYEGQAEVAVYDRQGLADPAFTLIGDLDPEANYGWERVYGSNQPLTAGDIPVIANGVCRVRWVPDAYAFALDYYDWPSSPSYVEIGRVTVWTGNSQYAEILAVTVDEWTPERAVVKVRLQLNASLRCTIYLTLQRGWPGPRIEVYSRASVVAQPPVSLRVTTIATVAAQLGLETGAVAITDGTNYGDFAGLAPWVYMATADPDATLPILMAVVQESVTLVGHSAGAYGDARSTVELTDDSGYVSATFASAARGDTAGDAAVHGQTNLMDCRAVPTLVAS
jgi:hypothetical protein